MLHLLSQRFLCSPNVRNELISQVRYLNNEERASVSQNLTRLKEILFTDLYQEVQAQPDHYWRPSIENFFKGKNLAGLTTHSLNSLSSALLLRSGQVYVDEAHWQTWQFQILAVSPLLMLCQFLVEQQKQNTLIDANTIMWRATQNTCIPSIFCPQIEHFLTKNPLIESHLHLNGTTEPDLVWQEALNKPVEFYHAIALTEKNSPVNELYLLNTHFRPADLPEHLKLARKLRDNLINYLLLNNKTPPDNWRIGAGLHWTDSIHPYRHIDRKQRKISTPWQYEGLFLIRCLRELKNNSNYNFALQFQCYLSLYHSFQHLLVQQKKQVGFDQFQKFTFNELRWPSEDSANSYQRRFEQLQGMHGHSIGLLEGRFSPKDNINKYRKLLHNIGTGYESFNKQTAAPMELGLVSHFIKRKDSRLAESIITFRDLLLRLDVRQKMLATCSMLRQSLGEHADTAKHCFSGFDAAANELDASPEVFAPVFRELRFLGFNNFTYHAGEDYTHLLGGMRAIYEAVIFLNFQSGNRLGHCTAIGIEPSLWEKYYANKDLIIEQGQWLDNLLFAWFMSSKTATKTDASIIISLEQEILRCAYNIYGHERPVSINSLVMAWQARHLDPFVLFDWPKTNANPQFDAQQKKEIENLPPNIRELLELYHSNAVIKKYQKEITITEPLSIIPCDLLRTMQNQLIDLLNQKNIAIETLPTSNVLISFYKNYEEHHLLRWLGLVNADDPQPSVVVGSDDTGIFMTNLRNEYSYIFKMVSKIKGNTEALAVLERLHKSAELFRFHPEIPAKDISTNR